MDPTVDLAQCLLRYRCLINICWLNEKTEYLIRGEQGNTVLVRKNRETITPGKTFQESRWFVSPLALHGPFCSGWAGVVGRWGLGCCKKYYTGHGGTIPLPLNIPVYIPLIFLSLSACLALKLWFSDSLPQLVWGNLLLWYQPDCFPVYQYYSRQKLIQQPSRKTSCSSS